MIRLPAFEHYAPTTIAEAVNLMREHGPGAAYVAGGTDLYPKMKRRQVNPQVLISLQKIAALRVVEEGDGLVLGAGLTLAEVAAHPLIEAQYPTLARAATLVASPSLRNAGTLGGNLCLDTRCSYYDQSRSWREALGFCLKKDGDTCWVAPGSAHCLAVSSTDCAPVVIALRGKVRLAHSDGERTLPAENLYHNDGRDYLNKTPAELLTAIHLPHAGGWRTAYWKLSQRAAIDFPVLSVAVALHLRDDGVCREARIVLGAVGSKPLLLAEEITAPLLQKPITQYDIDLVAQAAYRTAKPLDNTGMPLAYRKKVARLYIAGALAEAAGLPVSLQKLSYRA